MSFQTETKEKDQGDGGPLAGKGVAAFFEGDSAHPRVVCLLGLCAKQGSESGAPGSDRRREDGSASEQGAEAEVESFKKRKQTKLE